MMEENIGGFRRIGLVWLWESRCHRVGVVEPRK